MGLQGVRAMRKAVKGIAVVIVLLFICGFVGFLLYYRGIHMIRTVEAGTGIPDAGIFAKNNKKITYLTNMEQLIDEQLGTYKVSVSVNGSKRIVWLKYEDTVAPEGAALDHQISALEELKPSDFVTDIKDANIVKVYFKEKPSFGTQGEYPVTIVLEDMAGNKSTVLSKLTIQKVVPEVIVEAGEEFPNVSAFLYDERDSGEFATDISKISNKIPGTYEIKILSKGEEFTSKLVIVDTMLPEVFLKDVDILPGETVSAEDFIESVQDASDTSVFFVTPPDLSAINAKEVVIAVKDAAGNQTETSAVLNISKVYYTVEIETRTNALALEEVVKKPEYLDSAVFETQPDVAGVGMQQAAVNIGGEVFVCNVLVKDTVPPDAAPVALTMFVGDEVSADLFVKDIHDVTKVNVEFVNEPDMQLEGVQDVSVLLTDEGGNSTQIISDLTLVLDIEPPKIYGVTDKTYYVDDSISYLSGISATDNRDKEVTVEVDKQQVNLKKAGSYTVYYTAADAAGNVATKSAVITVKELIVTQKMLDDLAAKVLKKIINDKMSMGEKAWAIYQYTNQHVTYIGYSDKSDWKKEAYRGIIKGTGDCFTYFAVAKLLLGKIGAELMDVTRVGGTTRHYWMLCNLGTGWYHFDACIHKDPYCTFMLRDSDVEAYTKKHAHYYSFDKSKFPRTPKTPYKVEPLPEPEPEEEPEAETQIPEVSEE